MYTLTPRGAFLKKPHGKERREAGRKASRKLIPPQAAIFSACIRPSCGSASAGIRSLVRESPSIKIHEGWPGAEGSAAPGEKRKTREKKLAERERTRDGRTAGRVTEASRGHAHAYFASCTRVHTYVRARAAAVAARGPGASFHKTARLINKFRRRLGNKLAAALNTCSCTLVRKPSEHEFAKNKVRLRRMKYVNQKCCWD